VAHHKNQHYVPRCHFKPFTVGGEGRAIHLFNIPNALPIPNAPVKGQCSKNYFHGKDGLEDELANIEGMYGSIVHPLIDGRGPSSFEDLSFLAAFSYLQYHRTKSAIQRKRYGDLEMQDAAFYNAPDQRPDFDLSDTTLVHESIELFKDSAYYIDDLKCSVMRNNTSRDFVTSDDPAILTNRFYIQRLDRTDFGIASSGAILVLPLSPQFLFLAYDGRVYTMPDKHGDIVTLNEVSDVLALNELQYLKASENIYFANWSERELIAREYEQARPRRIDAWSIVRVAVPTDDTRTVYKESSREEASRVERALMHLQAIFPRPSTWLSKLKHRSPPRTFPAGGAGHVRKREFLAG
jgi:hypothetical protein